MADLNIKKKNNKKPLLWAVLALIAIVAIIWVIAGDNEDETYVESQEEVVTEPETWGDDSGTPEQSYNLDAEAEEAIEQFVSFTSELGEIEIDHETSHKGITLLADALASLTDNTQNEVEELRQQANQLLEDPMSEKHAAITRDAFMTAANIIEERIAKEATEVTEAAQAVDGDVLVTNQKDAVKNFFDTAANTLNNLE